MSSKPDLSPFTASSLFNLNIYGIVHSFSSQAANFEDSASALLARMKTSPFPLLDPCLAVVSHGNSSVVFFRGSYHVFKALCPAKDCVDS